MSQAQTACSQRQFFSIYVYDSNTDKQTSFCDKLKVSLPEVQVVPVDSAELLVKSSQVIITATPSQVPVIPNEKDLLKGKNFIGIGSYKPNMREFPEELFRLLDAMYIDTDFAVEETGDVIDPIENHWIPRDRIFTLGKLINGDVSRSPEAGETTLFKSVGMALFDLIVSEFLYRKAKEKGLGQEVSL